MSNGSHEQLLHVLDLAFSREWGRAKTLAETIDDPLADRLFLLLGDIEEREEARTRQLAVVRHEIGNALSVAQANLEAMIDGILDTTPQRLQSILNALVNASTFLEELRRGVAPNGQRPERIETFNLCDFVALRVKAVTGLANAKRVTLDFAPKKQPPEACVYRADVVQLDAVIRESLLNVIRATEPGGRVGIEWRDGHEAVHLALDLDASAAATTQRWLKHLNIEIDPTDDQRARTVFSIELPVARVDRGHG